MVFFQTQNEGFSAVPAPGPVTIDGDAADWDLSGRIWSFGDLSVRESHSVRTAAMWDAENLYLLFDWRDPTPMTSRVNPAFDPGRGWVSDAVQLRMLAGDLAFWSTAWLYDHRIPTVTFESMDAGDLWNPTFLDKLVLFREDGGTEVGEGFASAYREAADGTGFVHELRIPWSRLHVQPAAGYTMRLGLEFLWGPASGDTFPSHRYADNMQPGKLSREFYWTAKDAWGDLVLRAGPVPEPRRYVPELPVSQGAIAVSVDVPVDVSTVTLAIDDTAGRRIRNLVGGADPELYADPDAKAAGPTRRLRAMWDGLDDSGKPVPAGDYVVRPLVLGKALHGVYERCFYNPGTPPWSTPDHTGAWAADHAVIRHLAATEDGGIVAWCDFAEGGAGAIGIGPDGRKRWGDVRGAACAAVSGRFAYSLPNDWNAMGTQLLRVDAQTGAFAPFVRDGRELPMPLPLSTLFGLDIPPQVSFLCANDGVLALVEKSGDVHLFDAETAAPLRQFAQALPANATACTLRGGRLLFFAEGKAHALDVTSGAVADVPLSGAEIAHPVALAYDGNGALYVLDDGADCQVKKFAPDGAYERAFGKKGGRPGQGHFEPDGLYSPTGLAVDAKGAVWVAECSRRPRRVSVWSPEGALLRDYIGNAGYSASGTGLHDTDPKRGWAEGNEIAFGAGGERDWNVAELMQTPDESLVGAPDKDPPPELGDNGHMFFSSASGTRHEYFVAPGTWGGGLVVLMRGASGSWRTVSALCNIATLQRSYGGEYGAQIIAGAKGQFEGCDPADIVLWTDRNGDELVQRSECTLAPAAKRTWYGPGSRAENGDPSLPLFGGKGWYRRVRPEDFSFFASGTRDRPGTWRIAPTSFTDDGAPVWTLGSWTEVPLAREWTLMESTPVPGSTLVVAFAHRRPGDGSRESDWVVGFDGMTGDVRWTYPSPFHGVHGSHDAPMARPGLLIGCLRICGTMPAGGDSPALFMIRGNLGEDYWMTQDGLFVSSFLRDGRLPAPPLPATEKELFDMPMEGFTGGSEHFCGWAGRQDDGVVRVSCGLSREAAMVFRVENLETARVLDPVRMTVTEVDVARAAEERASRAAGSAAASRRLAIPHRAKESAASDAPVTLRLSREGQAESADVRLSWSEEGLHADFAIADPLSPWQNSSTDATTLFKGGDAIDIRIRPNAGTAPDAVEGDVRFVVGPFHREPYVLVMREKAPGAAAERHRIYSSPVFTVAFDDVGTASEDVRVEARATAEGATVSVTIPWRELGFGSAPASGTQLRGDIGLLCSDAAGQTTMARIFWCAKGGNLVSDLPSEARLNPGAWGELVLESK